MILLRGAIFLCHLLEELDGPIILYEKFRKDRLVQNQILQTLILILTAEPRVECDKRKTIRILLRVADRKIRMRNDPGKILNAGPGEVFIIWTTHRSHQQFEELGRSTIYQLKNLPLSLSEGSMLFQKKNKKKEKKMGELFGQY